MYTDGRNCRWISTGLRHTRRSGPTALTTTSTMCRAWCQCTPSTWPSTFTASLGKSIRYPSSEAKVSFGH
eukprot:9504082-Pyramimonas_sp.AAC.1